MSGKVISISFRRPQVSMCRMASRPNTKLTAPMFNEYEPIAYGELATIRTESGAISHCIYLSICIIIQVVDEEGI